MPQFRRSVHCLMRLLAAAATYGPLFAATLPALARAAAPPAAPQPAAAPTEVAPTQGAATADDVRSLLDRRRFDEAEAEARSLVASAQARDGGRSLEAADALGLLVEVLVRRGAAAQPQTRELAEHALALTEQLVGPDDPRTATRVQHLGHVALLGNDLPAARALYERALAIRERALGPEHAEVAASLGDLAAVMEDAGDLAGAQPLYERALEVAERAHGPRHPDVAVALTDLAGLLGRRGQFERARPMLERALSIREEALGPTHPDVAHSLNALAVLLRNTGDFAGARARFERALQVREQALGPDHPDLARTLNNLASLLAETGDLAAARPLFERALALRERALGPDHRDVATSTNNLANVLLQTGDYASARPLFERALAIWEKTLGPDHLNVAICLDNLASVAGNQGEFDRSRQLHERALAIKEKVLGPEHPSVAVTLDDLANVALSVGDRPQALRLYERALAIKEKTLPPEHPDLARGVDNLASALYANGESARALPLHERALALRLKTLGPRHPDVALSHRNCAFSQLAAGDTARALASALQAEAVGRDHLRLTSRSLGEREALRYASVRYGGLDLALSLVTAGGGSRSRGNPDAAEVWDALVRSRAVVLDEMAARHRSVLAAGDPAIDSLAAALQGAREQLAALTVRGPGNDPSQAFRQSLEAAARAKETAERALAERNARFQVELARARVGLAEVLQALPPGAVLVAYSRFARVPAPAGDQAAAWMRAGPGSEYAAFVGRHGDPADDAIALVPLGAAAGIDSLADAWRREAGRFAWGDQARAREAECRRLGEQLRRRVWDPIAASLGEAQLILVVPDGALHLVNLAGLPAPDGGYLIEERLLHVLSAERDVVRPPDAPGRGVLAVGNPDYERASGGAGGRLPELVAMLAPFRGARPGCAAFEQLRFSPLPETGAEIAAVGRQWKRARRHERVTALTGRHAGEARVKAGVSGKRVVHLATHGFFLGGECPPTPAEAAVRHAEGSVRAETPLAEASLENPLLLSGLALAGSNRRGQAPADAEDGVLTAEEVASLDLRGVEWAVLSACETATGDVQAGEGVFGLRRAFETAGAHCLVMSLWAVEDRAGRAFMDELYRARFGEGLSTAQAMRQAALRVLEERRRKQVDTHPSTWAGFIAAGDWR